VGSVGKVHREMHKHLPLVCPDPKWCSHCDHPGVGHVVVEDLTKGCVMNSGGGEHDHLLAGGRPLAEPRGLFVSSKIKLGGK
jgi:hypothetical protein